MNQDIDRIEALCADASKYHTRLETAAHDYAARERLEQLIGMDRTNVDRFIGTYRGWVVV